MALNSGTPGVAVTPLVNGVPVTDTNPLPVTSSPPFPEPVGPEITILITGIAGGDSVYIPAVPNKNIYVTGYQLQLSYPQDTYFTSVFTGTHTAITPRSTDSWGAVDKVGSESYLFCTRSAASEEIGMHAQYQDVKGGLQLRYRVAL